MASPQVEDGYTKIANELLDAMCRVQLSGQQWKVLHAIIRKTYGWNQKADWISGSQIAQMTGLNRIDVCQALHVLRQRRIILRDHKLTGVQKDYAMWLDVTQTGNVTQMGNTNTVTETGNTVTEIGNKMLPKQAHTKDTKTPIQKKERATQFSNDHPAVSIFAELTGKRPKHGTLQYIRIAETVTDAPDKLDKWREAVDAWLGNGNKDTNVYGMLDWFKSGRRDCRRIPLDTNTQDVIRVNGGGQI